MALTSADDQQSCSIAELANSRSLRASRLRWVHRRSGRPRDALDAQRARRGAIHAQTVHRARPPQHAAPWRAAERVAAASAGEDAAAKAIFDEALAPHLAAGMIEELATQPIPYRQLDGPRARFFCMRAGSSTDEKKAAPPIWRGSPWTTTPRSTPSPTSSGAPGSPRRCGRTSTATRACGCTRPSTSFARRATRRICTPTGATPSAATRSRCSRRSRTTPPPTSSCSTRTATGRAAAAVHVQGGRGDRLLVEIRPLDRARLRGRRQRPPARVPVLDVRVGQGGALARDRADDRRLPEPLHAHLRRQVQADRHWEVSRR